MSVCDGDCDDTSASYHPNAREDDCEDARDYNCDGSVGYDDEDGDGFAACADCDDGDAGRYPDADELCDDIDQDCDDSVDEAPDDISSSRSPWLLLSSTSTRAAPWTC